MGRPVQLEFPTWGGKRKGAGRKRKAPRALVSHKKRPAHVARVPVHAVLRTAPDVPNLRSQEVYAAIDSALRQVASGPGFRVVHFSVQSNHLHLIDEAGDRDALSKGMHAVTVRVARAVNRATGRRGRVFADHYFARDLKTPAEVRRAVRYVLDNHMLHGNRGPQTDDRAIHELVQPRTWLLRTGWLKSRAGPLPVAYWET